MPEHVYTSTEREAVRDRLQTLYSPFNVQVYIKGVDDQDVPAGMAYVTIYFNRSRFQEVTINGQQVLQPQPGGESEDVDFRNVSLAGAGVVQVNGLLGGDGQPPFTAADGTDNFIPASVFLAGHELGHMMGLRARGRLRTDRFLASATRRGELGYIPPYTGPSAAFESNDAARWPRRPSPASRSTTSSATLTLTSAWRSNWRSPTRRP